MDKSYLAVISRKTDILKKATGIDYDHFEISPLAFDYDGLMKSCDFSLEDVGKILQEVGVGQTPLVELKI